jgi:hypothetical protein
VNRVVSMLLLAAFAAQHFMCCCSGLGGHACGRDQSAGSPVCQIATGCDESISDSDCCEEQCCHDHDEPCDGIHSHDHDCPGNGSHGHHLCVASHFFFVPTPRAALPPSMDWHDFGFWPAESSLLITLAALTIAIHDGVDFGPPLTAQARRSALCVYRI